MLFPKEYQVTAAIIQHYHLYSLFGRPDLALSLIKLKFWIPDGNSAVKQELRKCTTCMKSVAKPITQYLCDLPASGITPSRPSSAYWDRQCGTY